MKTSYMYIYTLCNLFSSASFNLMFTIRGFTYNLHMSGARKIFAEVFKSAETLRGLLDRDVTVWEEEDAGSVYGFTVSDVTEGIDFSKTCA